MASLIVRLLSGVIFNVSFFLVSLDFINSLVGALTLSSSPHPPSSEPASSSSSPSRTLMVTDTGGNEIVTFHIDELDCTNTNGNGGLSVSSASVGGISRLCGLHTLSLDHLKDFISETVDWRPERFQLAMNGQELVSDAEFQNLLSSFLSSSSTSANITFVWHPQQGWLRLLNWHESDSRNPLKSCKNAEGARMILGRFLADDLLIEDENEHEQKYRDKEPWGSAEHFRKRRLESVPWKNEGLIDPSNKEKVRGESVFFPSSSIGASGCVRLDSTEDQYVRLDAWELDLETFEEFVRLEEEKEKSKLRIKNQNGITLVDQSESFMSHKGSEIGEEPSSSSSSSSTRVSSGSASSMSRSPSPSAESSSEEEELATGDMGEEHDGRDIVLIEEVVDADSSEPRTIRFDSTVSSMSDGSYASAMSTADSIAESIANSVAESVISDALADEPTKYTDIIEYLHKLRTKNPKAETHLYIYFLDENYEDNKEGSIVRAKIVIDNKSDGTAIHIIFTLQSAWTAAKKENSGTTDSGYIATLDFFIISGLRLFGGEPEPVRIVFG